jgi:hypothetical protein
MIFKIITNLYKKIKDSKEDKAIIFISSIDRDNDNNESFKNVELLNQVLEKCTHECTDITGLEGTGKSNFISLITNKLYSNKNSYLMCSNSIKELAIHFKKHLIDDDILIFCLKGKQSHAIDINYLFSLDLILDFICFSEKEKEILKISNYPTWFSFFDDIQNEKLFKPGYFNQLKEFIKSGHIDEYGDLNKNNCNRPISAYLTLQEEAYYYNLTDEDKNQFIFFLNLLQISLSQEKINVIFDENKVFFDGYRNNYSELLTLIGQKNNFIFSSLFFEDVYRDFQVVCFKGEIGNDFDDYLKPNRLNKLDIKDLKPGCFYYFSNTKETLTLNPIKIPDVEEDVKINWDIFINTKPKKMYEQLQLDLIINDIPQKKKLKI